MILMAMDRASVRQFDKDGRLHVTVTNISKATVNPYRGGEIPGWEALGLDADRVYMLLRHPDELAEAASTFNNLPVLNCHVPVSAGDHQPDCVVGSTGTDGVFTDPYLQNSAVVWAQDSIDLINSDEQRQWSCGYYYDADMTPGNYRGLQYDGIMRNIVGNHVALVAEGRAGPDVVVGDASMLKSRKALMLSGAIAALIRPRLAADAKIDFTSELAGVTAATLPANRDKIAARVLQLVEGKLAADSALTLADVLVAFDAVADLADKAEDEDDEDDDKAKDADIDAEDEDDDAPKPGGMDAATIRADTIAEMNAIHAAARAVEPFVGALDVMPATAAAVYKLALDAAGVDLAGVHTSAYGALVKLLPAPSTTVAPVLAADASTLSDFRARFPGAATLRRS